MKRIFAFIIAAVMLFSMLPAMAFAAQEKIVYLDPAAGLDTNDGLT